MIHEFAVKLTSPSAFGRCHKQSGSFTVVVLCIFELTKQRHEPLVEINMLNSVYSTPIIANGVMYISNKDHVFAIQEPVGGAEK